MKKKRRIKWGNWFLLTVLTLCLAFLAKDIFNVFVQPLFTGYGVSFTYYGLIIDFIVFLATNGIFDYFDDLMED